MLTREQNELLTRTDPGTPGGDLIRSYWQPVALSEELPADGAPVPLRICGEDLVLFRDDGGRPGLLGIHCSHRAADLSYGRVEDGGLRCPYHGWLYDVQGNCLEQPAEPASSSFCAKIKHLAYPCREVGEIIFAYLGAGEPPLFPNYEFLLVPEAQRFVSKLHHECNYLQANEGNIDPTHLSFLHRFLDESAASDLRSNRTVAGSSASPNMLFGRDLAPRIEVEDAHFGVRIFTLRDAGEGSYYVRISNFIMPNLSSFPGQTGGEGYSVNWHVPIDDVSHWKYTITFTRSAPLEKDRLREINKKEMLSGYRLRRNKDNRYLQDREEMKTRSFLGMGSLFQGHDKYATEGEGPILDRTAERLGAGDRAITAARQMMLRAIREMQDGADPPHVIRDQSDNLLDDVVVVSEVVPAGEDWRTYWRRSKNNIPLTAAAMPPVLVSAE